MAQHKTESNAALRPASMDDADSIFRVLVSGFRIAENTDRWNHIRNMAYGSTEQFLVIEKAGEVIAALVIWRHWLRIGTVKVLKGDIGEVAVLRELQGQGLGTQLMQGGVNHLRENGFHLSRLGGLNRFYARFGYVPFPRRYYEFLLTGAHAGADIIPPERLIALSPEQERRVRLYYPHRDWQRRDDLYEHFNQNRSGSLVRSRSVAQPSVSKPDPDSLNLVYEENGRVVGYLFASEHAEEHSPFEAQVRIGDVAFQTDKPEAFKTLMCYVLREAVRRGAQRVTARLPFDPLVQKLLTEAAVPFSLRELQSAPASNMMMLVNLPGLFEAIAPELTRRYSGIPPCPPFSIRIQVDEQAAALVVKPSSVEPTDDRQTDAQLSCDANTFLRWTLGLNGFDEWQTGVIHNLTGEQARVLAALFRREPCASGPWG